MSTEINNGADSVRTFYPLGEIFAEKLFQIPDYQRGYAWEQKQCKDLLDDISLLEKPTQQHFFGTLILHDVEKASAFQGANDELYRRYHVIDGQQRLTTTILYLNLLRQELQSLERDQAMEISNQYIWARDQADFRLPRLTLNKDSHSFFQQVILEGQAGNARKIRSHLRLVDAHQFFADHLAQKKAEQEDNYSAWLAQ